MTKRELLGLAVLNLMTAGCGGGGSGGGSAESCTEASVCDDHVDCTTDTCQGVCQHLPVQARCASGTICDSKQGCSTPPACGSEADCPDLGPCSLAACNAASCSYQDLDNDGDGQGPQICGGLDCDDARPTVHEGAPEQCNGLDDDCDGAIDGFTEACGTDEGECTGGVHTCESGSLSPCDDVGPQTEACDDLDNDCDGDTDEPFDVGMPCDGPDGDLCDEGVWGCDVSGTGATCNDSSGTTVEICDGSDDDCDGSTDEGACIPNIGVWCDPADGSGEDEINPACDNDARCLELADGTNGICAVFGCREDVFSTGTNEDSCFLDYGIDYVCIDLQGNVDTNLADNVCVEKCTPSDTSNPCQSPFACTPFSVRFNFSDAVCIDLACTTGSDCPVTITDNMTCVSDFDCPGATDFCELSVDTDGDGVFDIGACALPGVCDPDNGLCAPHSLGSASARIGDPCQADTDCTDGGTCVNQGVYVDLYFIWHQVPRNGYCTMFGCKFAGATGFDCPAGSACHNVFFAGGCMDLCDQEDPTGCRDDLDADGDPTGNGTPCDVAGGITTNCDWYADYDCYNWSGLQFGNGLPVVDGPDSRICDYITPVQRTCVDFLPIGGCPAVGPLGNSTAMDCRYPESGIPTPTGTDDFGRCLDTTTSGDLCPGFFDFNGNCIP